MKQSMSVLTSQSTVQWYTPPDITNRARTVMGSIDLDPASTDYPNTWIRATRIYTLELPDIRHLNIEDRKRTIKKQSREQLMKQPTWKGNIFLNPPFDDTTMWVNRLHSSYQQGGVEAVLLVNTAAGYGWWERLWRHYDTVLLKDRLSFIREDGTQGGPAKKGQTLAYFGTHTEHFFDVYQDLGRCIRKES